MNTRWTRRRWMQTLLTGSAGLALSRLAGAQDGARNAAQNAAESPPAERAIELFNTHTNEHAHVVYKRGADYDPAGLETLKKLLRDHRNGEM